MKLDLKKLKIAAGDMRYLLDKGYPRKRTLELVGNRYGLLTPERHLLHRAIFSQKEASFRRKKLITLERIKKKTLAIDGHNVLITLQSALKSKWVVLAQDGVVRDISGISRGFKVDASIRKSLSLVTKVLCGNRPKSIRVFFDAPMSKSGELAKMVGELLMKKGLKAESQAVKVPERELLNFPLISSSDSDVINRAKEVFDLAGYIIRKRLRCNLIKL